MVAPGRKHIVLDTDTGVDDALAIMLALLSPELSVEAITTVSGNVHVDLCTRNALLMLEQLGLKNPPPVAKGAAKPYYKDLITAPEVHGSDGIGGVTAIKLPDGTHKYPEPSLTASSVPAWETIVRLARELGSGLTLVTVGPLTNIAIAIAEDRTVMESIGGIIMMGGAFRVYGNTTTVAEFNVYVDPHAAEEVLNLGVPVTIVPLDVTERTVLTRRQLNEAYTAHPSKAMETAIDVSRFYMDYHQKHDALDGCYMHDPLAVGVAVNPKFIRTVDSVVYVEREGEWTQGMTVADLRPSHAPAKPNAKVAVEVDADGFIDFFLGRLASL